MGLHETYKDRHYQDKINREAFWFLFASLVAISWFLPTMLFPNVDISTGIANSIKLKGLKETLYHYKAYLILFSLLYFFIWFILYFDGEKSKIAKLISSIFPSAKPFFQSEKAKGYFPRVNSLFNKEIRISDGVKKRELDIFKGALKNTDSSKLLFGVDTENIRMMFEQDEGRTFDDLFEVIEELFAKKEVNGIEVGCYDEIDEVSDFSNFRAERFENGGNRVYFSVNAIRTLLDVATEDFIRFYKRNIELGQNTIFWRIHKENSLTLKEGVDISKMRVIFKLVIFHSIVKKYIGLPVGFINARLLDYDTRAVLAIYQKKDTLIEITDKNDGSNDRFYSDIFPNIFLTTFHLYMRNTKSFDWEVIYKRFDPLLSFKAGLGDNGDEMLMRFINDAQEEISQYSGGQNG